MAIYIILDLAFSAFAFPEFLASPIHPDGPRGLRVVPVWHELEHASLAFFAGLFTMDLGLAFMALLFAIFLDVDHIPIMLGLNVPVRASHSLLFAILAGLTIGVFFRRPTKRFDWGLATATITGVMTHLVLDATEAPFRPFSPFPIWEVDPTANFRFLLGFFSILVALPVGLSKVKTNGRGWLNAIRPPRSADVS